MTQKLSIGLSDFRGLREDGYKYIDKTKYLHRLCTRGKFYFLARPRRFGKSLMLTTLQEIYLGSKELFMDLWIENNWDWSKKHPVIRLSMKMIDDDELGLRTAIQRWLVHTAASHAITLPESGLRQMFSVFIEQLSQKGKVVVLIDEYDAPILNYLGTNTAKALENREVLRDFYTILKEYDNLLEFVMLTGVSKFSKVGVFSGLNNLNDISMEVEFATMLGYTQQELEAHFDEELKEAAAREETSYEEILAKIKFWYNGYRFHEKSQTVYNPWSVQQCFNKQEFKNYWFETGTPRFLIELMREKGVYELTQSPVESAIFSTFEPDNLHPDTLLYQTGYLTLTERNEDGMYLLDYPNYEVRESMLQSLIPAFTGIQHGRSLPFVVQLRNAFQHNDIETAISLLETMFADIPSDIYGKLPKREAFYHAALHLIFDYVGLRMRSEESVANGKSDTVVETRTHVYILEYKLNSSAEIALAQIETNNYAQKYRHRGKIIIGIGINFSHELKNMDGWLMKVLA